MEERKLNASLLPSNKLEKTMMLLTCIRAVVVSNYICNTDCTNRRSSQHFPVPRGKCGDNSCNKANVFKKYLLFPVVKLIFLMKNCGCLCVHIICVSLLCLILQPLLLIVSNSYIKITCKLSQSLEINFVKCNHFTAELPN